MKLPYAYPKLKNAVSFRMPDAFFLLSSFGKGIIDPQSIRNIDRLFERGFTLKDSETTTAVLAAVSPEGSPVFLKRNNNKGLRFTLKNLFRPSRVFHAAEAAELLAETGIRTPRVLLVGERRSGLLLKAGYLVTETMPEIHSVWYLIRETDTPQALLDSFLLYAAKTAAALHNAKIEHGDLKVINFFHTGRWTPESDYGIWDLDSVRRHKFAIPRRRVEKELSRIVFSIHYIAGFNPKFPEELSSVALLAEKLVALYNDAIPRDLPHPCVNHVKALVEKRLDRLRKHPYKTHKGNVL